MTLNKGQLFCVVSGASANLYCRVTGFDGAVIEATVINGAWDFELHPDGVMRYNAPSGPCEQRGWTIATHPRLGRFGDDYQAAIIFMEEEGLKHSRARMWIESRAWRALSQWHRFKRAFSNGCAAFKLAWSPRKEGERMSDYELFHDDISF